MKITKVFTAKRTLLVASILLFVLLILGISVHQIVTAQSKANTPNPNSDEAAIKALEEDLRNPNLDEKSKKSLQGKLQVYYHNATKQADTIEQLTSIPKRSNATPQIPIIKTSPRKTGIINRPSVPFPSSAYKIENAWQEKVNDNYILIFAGIDATQTEKGVLIIKSDTNKGFEFFYTPTNSGSIKIIDVKGYQLVLKGKGKDNFYFDVPGRKFISSLGEIVPTVTPNPDTLKTTSPTPTIPAYP